MLGASRPLDDALCQEAVDRGRLVPVCKCDVMNNVCKVFKERCRIHSDEMGR